ncbi:MAG: pilus assembly protein [Desulfosporosinus sp.]|nr:pilus assembly protein [Desulfosporosinus sp.]
MILEHRKGDEGQALVEMALILPLLFLLLFGVIEMGRIGYAYISISNATREGATCNNWRNRLRN